MSDLISRQAAIDSIQYAGKIGKQTCISILKRLPTAQPEVLACGSGELNAQPERTCVNCGRTVNNGGWYADGRTRCPIEEHYALPKDGYCHLWEKRNVTDDDYPERREDERERLNQQTGGN